MNNDAVEKIAELIREAAQQAGHYNTNIVVTYDDESNIYDSDGDLSENRDIHIKVAAEPKR